MKKVYSCTRPRRHVRAFLVACGILAYLLTSCATTKPDAAPPAATETQQWAARPGTVDSLDMSPTPMSATYPTTYPAKPALLPRLTDAIGLSTPEGRARRQAVKLAKASAPKVGKGGVYAVNSTVSNGYKSDAPSSAAAPGATVSNAAENSQQQAVQGDNNDLQAKQANPQQEAPGFGGAFGKVLGAGMAPVLVLVCVGGGLWLLWKRKRDTQS